MTGVCETKHPFCASRRPAVRQRNWYNIILYDNKNIYIYIYTYIYIHIYIYIERDRERFRQRKPPSGPWVGALKAYLPRHVMFRRSVFVHGHRCYSEGGMIRLETLIELNLFNSSFSSLISYCNRTNIYLSSSSGRQYLDRQYPPPLLTIAFDFLWATPRRGPSKGVSIIHRVDTWTIILYIIQMHNLL